MPTPEEAAIVKRIFQNFLDGKSRLETEREFAAEGITTREGKRWVDSNIKSTMNITFGRMTTGNTLGCTAMKSVLIQHFWIKRTLP